MASKLELRFTSIPEEFDLLDIAGTTFVFRNQRTGQTMVTIGTDPWATVSNLANAFNIDVNYLGQFDVTWQATLMDGDNVPIPDGGVHGILRIEHPENGYFDDFATPYPYIIYTVTDTPQVVKPTITVAVTQSPTDTCNRFNLNIQGNLTQGSVTAEIPIGNRILNIPYTDLPYDFNTIRPASNTTGVVKLWNGTTLISNTFFNAPGVVSLSEPDVTGSPFGAAIQINATGVGLEYSLNNTDWQNSKEFTGLLAGNFTAYVRDAYGCQKSISFIVTEDQVTGLSVDPLIKVPIHNSLRFADRDGETFLNFLATETPSFLNIKNFYQDYLLGDVIRMQFKSSYPSNRVYQYDCQGAETEISVIQKSDNISRKNIYEGNYINYDGRLAVYFDSGNVYNPDNTVKDTHFLSGLLPDWYEEGMYIQIEGAGVTKIDRIVFDEDAEVRYAVTLKTFTETGLSKKITSIHTAHPYEVFEFEINFLETGKFMFKLDYGAGVFLSEPVKVHEQLSDKYLTVEWFSNYNNDIIYGTGIRQMRRIQWSKYFNRIPKGEKEPYYADTTLGIVNSKNHSTYELSFMPMPMEMARGLDFGFNAAGSYVIINGAVFVCDGAYKEEPFGSMVIPTAELTLADQSMKGQQNVNDAIIAEFLIIEQDVSGVKFLRL